MQIHVYDDAETVARRAAEYLTEAARQAAAARGRFALAVSGGSTPWQMLRVLAGQEIPWQAVQLFQADERVAPDGDDDRNWTHIAAALQAAPLPDEQRHPMPVQEEDLHKGAADYAEKLASVLGSPPILDLIHLGIGPDGHTASLIPNDPVLEVDNRDVALADVYQGRRRMTLTYPAINRARRILWVVTGEAKAEMVSRLVAGDPAIPAGRVSQTHAVLLADRAAAAQLGKG